MFFGMVCVVFYKNLLIRFISLISYDFLLTTKINILWKRN